MHKAYKPDEAPEKYNLEETCSFCDTAIPIVIDDNCYEYTLTCPVCGKRLCLCTLCRWDQEDGKKGGCCC